MSDESPKVIGEVPGKNNPIVITAEDVDATPNDELRAKVEEWRELADRHPGGDDVTVGRNSAFAQCAEELEELLNE